MNFMEKIFKKDFDDAVHAQFMKFSRGEFKDRAVIKAKCTKGKYTINTTAEFANELVRDVAEKLQNNRAKVTGIVVSTADLRGKLNFKSVSQFQGVKRYAIDMEMSGKEILNLLKEFPKSFFALSFKTSDGETELKIKAKAPKSGKPKTKGDNEVLKPDFCKLTTTDEKLGKGFVFENQNFKEAEASHDFLIDEIIVTEEMKKEKDFAKIREMAMRKGRIIRKAKIDGKEILTEMEFKV